MRPLSGNCVLLLHVVHPNSPGKNQRKRAEETHGTLQRHRESVVRVNRNVALAQQTVPVLDKRPGIVHGQHLHGVRRRRRIHWNHNFLLSTQIGGLKRFHQKCRRIRRLFALLVVLDVVFKFSPRSVHGLVLRVAQFDGDFRRRDRQAGPFDR